MTQLSWLTAPELNIRKMLCVAAIALAAFSAGSASAAPAGYADPLAPSTLSTIRSLFGRLMELANRHDIKGLHEMFWQSPSALLVAKSAIASEGEWGASGAVANH
jgi:hypothetical protein